MAHEKDGSASADGCKIINELQKGRNILPYIAWITYGVALFIVACFAWRTFRPKDFSMEKSINVNVVDAQGQTKDLSADGKVYLKEQLHTALAEVSARAESAYNEKFATLLTILTIFGIAWPLIIGWIQSLTFKQAEERMEALIEDNRKQQHEIQQINYDFFVQVGDTNMKLAALQNFEMEKMNV